MGRPCNQGLQFSTYKMKAYLTPAHPGQASVALQLPCLCNIAGVRADRATAPFNSAPRIIFEDHMTADLDLIHTWLYLIQK